MTNETPKRIPIDLIKRVVADAYNLTPAKMIEKRRTKDVVKPRQIAMTLAKELSTSSLPQIGRRFNGCDHTTVLHAARTAPAKYPDEVEAMRAAVLAAFEAEEIEKIDPLDNSVLEALPPAPPPPPLPPPPPPEPVVTARPVFVPRKVRPIPRASIIPRPRVVTAYLLGDPGARSARVDRGEVSIGN